MPNLEDDMDHSRYDDQSLAARAWRLTIWFMVLQQRHLEKRSTRLAQLLDRKRRPLRFLVAAERRQRGVV